MDFTELIQKIHHRACVLAVEKGPDGDAERYAFASFAMEVVKGGEDSDTVMVKDGWISVSIIPLLQDCSGTMPLVERLL